MQKQKLVSLYEFFQRFPDEESARLYFESKRWQNGYYCGHCASVNIVECKDHKPMAYRCRDCRKHFSVRTGTLLAESRLPLQKWLMAIYMMTTARKGIPSTQMVREIGITQESSWFLAQRIRETWASENDQLDTNPVESDESYFGGIEKNKHESKKLHIGTGGSGKQAVFGILERGGKVMAVPVNKTDKVTLQGILYDTVKEGATVYTDTHLSYRGLIGYNHETVRHHVGEYVRHMAHTNGIESFWSLLKTGYYGIYHFMNSKHLHRYVDEFSVRHNTAQVDTMDFIGMTIERMVNRRLTYKELINA